MALKQVSQAAVAAARLSKIIKEFSLVIDALNAEANNEQLPNGSAEVALNEFNQRYDDFFNEKGGKKS